jgi:hypothetical protein
MSANDEERDESDMCRVVTDVAVNQAVERCGSEAAVKDVLADMFGFGDDEENPDCDTVLADGIQANEIDSPSKQRQVAMCVAWRYVQEEGMQFRSAVNQAWTDIREKEDELGV